MLNNTNSENHQPTIQIYEAPSIQSYLEAHLDAKKAYENEVIRLMEHSKLPGKLADTLPNNVEAYSLFLSTGELVYYQVSLSEVSRKYFVHPLVSSKEIEEQKTKRLLTKTVSNANSLVTSVNQILKSKK